MIRRILVAGVGGLLGFVLWYTLMSRPSEPAPTDGTMKYVLAFLVACVVGCGVVAVILGEKLGIIPSQEQLEAKEKPVSLFSASRSETQPTTPKAEPAAAAGASRESEPECPVSDDEILARVNFVRSNMRAPEWVYIGGGPDGFLVLQPTPSDKPLMLLFSSKYAARDYIRAAKVAMEVKQIKTADLPQVVQGWISRGVEAAILNRCPRCSEAVQFGCAQLLKPDGYEAIWAADQATRWWRGQVYCARMTQACESNSLTEARKALEYIRDHIDCGIPYVHQLIAFYADAENDVAAKQAACAELELFPAEFRWSPEYSTDNQRGAEYAAKALAGLAMRFPPVAVQSRS